MQIDRLELYHVRMPLRQPWQTALGVEESIDSILLNMQGGGCSVWAESSPHASPIYTSEWAYGAFALLRDHLCPRVCGQNFDSPEELEATLAIFRGNQHAKAALDFAWWTLDAQLKNLPLYKRLGGLRNSVEVGESFGVQKNIDELVRRVGQADAAGFRRVKLKVCRGWDLDMISAVRRTFPKLTLHIDCNGEYSLADLDLFKKLDRYELAAIEQPLAASDLEGHAQLGRQIATPIGLDESVTSLESVKHAIRIGACRWLFIKPARVGGLTASISICEFARSHGIICSVGSSLESAIGSELNLALATVAGFSYPASVFASDRHYEHNLATPKMILTRGPAGYLTATADEVPGILRTPDPELLKKWSLHSAVFGSL